MKISGIRNKHTALALSCFAKKKKSPRSTFSHSFPNKKKGEVMQPEPPRPCTLHRAIRRGIKLYLYYYFRYVVRSLDCSGEKCSNCPISTIEFSITKINVGQLPPYSVERERSPRKCRANSILLLDIAPTKQTSKQIPIMEYTLGKGPGHTTCWEKVILRKTYPVRSI